VHADDLAAQIHQLLRENAITAAKVENALARSRRQQIDHRHAEIAHESRAFGVLTGIPGLMRAHGEILSRAKGRGQRAEGQRAEGWDSKKPWPFALCPLPSALLISPSWLGETWPNMPMTGFRARSISSS